MSRKQKQPNFEEILNALRRREFAVTPLPGKSGEYLVSKYNCGAILAAAGKESLLPVAELETARYFVAGELATLYDRGFQKFLKTSKFEIAATAEALHAIHRFSEELKLVTGETVHYNEGLGTTSDQYHYDRLKGRDSGTQAPTPWALPGAH